MRQFRYHFDHGADGPTFMGLPVVYSPYLTTADPASTVVVQAGTMGCALTSDPDFEWNFYRAECREQARRIVREGLTKRLAWLKLHG